VAGAIFEHWPARRDAKDFPRRQLIDIDGRPVHLDCRGTVYPTVVLETGLGPAGLVTCLRSTTRLPVF